MIKWIFLLWLSAIFYVGYFVEQHEFVQICIGFFGAFGALSLMTYQRSTLTLNQILIIGLVARLILFPAKPQLSDDIYRFLWDGLMVLQGYNPFAYTPEMVRVNINNEYLYENMNSQTYYSVYPAICQIIFTIAAFISKGNILLSGLVIRSIFLLSEWLLVKTLLKYSRSKGINEKRLAWYILNPLVVLEVYGNLHFEIIVIALLVYALLNPNKTKLSALTFASSVATKLVPALTLPLFIRSIRKENLPVWLLTSGIIGILMFLPIFSAIGLHGFSTSLNLYFQNFEFNGSLYLLARAVGYQLVGYNAIATIGPVLAAISFLLILFISFYGQRLTTEQLLIRATLIFTVYFLFATTVHPWYVISPLILSIVTKYRFGILWSALAVLSYHSYDPSFQNISHLIIAIEYLPLYGMVAWELYRGYKKRAHNGALE